MKIVFVLNDGDGRYLEYEHTGILNAPKRRAVTIELTPDQVQQINIQQIGVDRGRPILESIESVSIEAKTD
jgi:hypothetical protein